MGPGLSKQESRDVNRPFALWAYDFVLAVQLFKKNAPKDPRKMNTINYLTSIRQTK